jgi:hypothetical protein
MLQPGEARLRVDRFAFTANNVTYGAFGEMLYWGFFPGSPGKGRIPVWGFGTIVDAGATGLTPGERLYGYWPMATHLVIRPDRIAQGGLVDASPHRQALPPVYNSYVRLGTGSPGAGADAERALFVPLFTTGFVIDDWLADNAVFGARRVIFLSASSKTALAAAECLKARGGIETLGLTSPANAAFTRGTGYYDAVASYEEIASLDAAIPSVLVDMAGGAQARAAVHDRLGEALRYSCAVGATQWDRMQAPSSPLPGPKPVQFFAPDQIRKRHREWGAAAYQAKLDAATARFLASVRPWLRVVEHKGPDAVEALYRAALDGKIAPADGHMASLWPA